MRLICFPLQGNIGNIITVTLKRKTEHYIDLSSLYVCMAIKYIIVLFVETPRKFITAKLSIRKPGSSSVLIICDLFNSHALFIYKSVVICWLASFKKKFN
jgi:hypothetical protein